MKIAQITMMAGMASLLAPPGGGGRRRARGGWVLPRGGGAARLCRAPAPEKWPGQRSAFRVGAWGGDGVASSVPTKRERDLRREERRRALGELPR